MQVVSVQWDAEGVSKTFRSEEVNDILYKAGMDIADAAEGPARTHIKGKVNGRMFGCKTKRLSNTCIAIIHPLNRAALNVQVKHNILKQIAK